MSDFVTTTQINSQMKKSGVIGDIVDTLKASSDAKHVHGTSILDIVNGEAVMAFGHIVFLKQFLLSCPSITCKDGFEDWEKKIDLLIDLCEYRNVVTAKEVNKLVRFHNCIIEQRNQFDKPDGSPKRMKTTPDSGDFEMYSDHILYEIVITEEMETLSKDVGSLIDRAFILGINHESYLETNPNVQMDIDQCFSSKWNHDQAREIQPTADSIVVITDLDGLDYVLTITRMFGPGNGCIAFQGGLIDKIVDAEGKEVYEDSEDAAERETMEEIGINLDTFPKDIERLTKQMGLSKSSVTPAKVSVNDEERGAKWDPRLRFGRFGTRSSAIAYHLVICV
jgi:8-oxo-dGTP pyrophosphatase MutT (NUDIX family)